MLGVLFFMKSKSGWGRRISSFPHTRAATRSRCGKCRRHKVDKSVPSWSGLWPYCARSTNFGYFVSLLFEKVVRSSPLPSLPPAVSPNSTYRGCCNELPRTAGKNRTFSGRKFHGRKSGKRHLHHGHIYNTPCSTFSFEIQSFTLCFFS